ncbi:MAG: dethiobiotin synthase [Pseudomonadota bacterium]
MQKGLFITGTDTDVGKTYVGVQIASALHESQLRVCPRKPIESGCKLIGKTLHPDDANQYFLAVEKKVSLDEICPYRFEPPISPQRAARLANQPINIAQAHQACIQNVSDEDFLIVEGAGGFYSPLCEDGLNADLAESLQLPVLLIANDQLGCINHILLTVETIKKRNLELSAIVLNSQKETHDAAMDNEEDLKGLVDVPIFSVCNNQQLTQDSEILTLLS